MRVLAAAELSLADGQDRCPVKEGFRHIPLGNFRISLHHSWTVGYDRKRPAASACWAAGTPWFGGDAAQPMARNVGKNVFDILIRVGDFIDLMLGVPTAANVLGSLSHKSTKPDSAGDLR